MFIIIRKKSFGVLAAVNLINLEHTIHKKSRLFLDWDAFSGNGIQSTKVRIFLRPMFNKLSIYIYIYKLEKRNNKYIIHIYIRTI